MFHSHCSLIVLTRPRIPWNQSTTMVLKIAIERNSCLRHFIVTLDCWQARNMFTYFFSVFFKKTETKIVIYVWFDQHLNSNIKIVMHSEWYKNCTIRQKIAVVAAMIHIILFFLYGNCCDKIQALTLIIHSLFWHISVLTWLLLLQ